MSILIVTVGLSCRDNEILPPPDENPITSDEFPTWSPDGRWVVYYHDDLANDSIYPSGLYIIDTTGNNLRLLIPGFASTPAWSPDSKWIAFCSGAIYAMSFEGDSIRQLTPFSAFFPSWSPDGKRIACGRSGPQDTVGIWIVDVDTPNAIRFDFGGAADWSPNGEWFTYAGPPNAYSLPEVYKVRINDKSKIRLTILGRNNLDSRWSRNGVEIVWWIQDRLLGGVWLMSGDGSNQRWLSSGKYGSLSPDSRRVVFADYNLDKTKSVLWIINRDGTNRNQVTH